LQQKYFKDYYEMWCRYFPLHEFRALNYLVFIQAINTKNDQKLKAVEMSEQEMQTFII